MKALEREPDELELARRVTFTAGEVAEFVAAIRTAPASDLPRHEQRNVSAARLRCYDDATAARFTAAIAARRQQLEQGMPR